ncbi:hypothetical protein M409DRAFT_21455 [Zasmidium cellare ATCC 36951]|uniref:Zn(2)-C6 fungal-type domain-containing protein n=1 Tax=Zasmidium cellare ATCC 36951 TaxID=1080233 RepID=A0A6A6CP26_ZASCE|nr:uncharacterized protein M409DRAFT_21455 [Zasmidium cellare ATCC 36951]KAF2168008.1 hypothetical protein M409DRAFT_21455 [Zasmidium cellare ATCC 36951]
MPERSANKRVSKAKTPSSNKTAASYTYTGCWTCRRRHIKCDLRRPACNRCIKAGFDCEGYDFKFAGSDSSRSFRRPVAPGSKAQQVASFTNAEVTGILDELDIATASLQKGPFSVLSFDSAAQDEPSTPTVDLALHPTRVKQELSSWESPQDSGFASQQTSPTNDTKSLTPIRTYYSPSPPMVQEPHFLTISGRQSELFEHWTTFLCHNLSPLTSTVNPFRYTYPSLALEGLTVTADVATARLAVFHGICGTAAWSLLRLKQHDQTYHALSVYHDQMALRYIQETIERPDGLHDAAIPAAIMSCLTGDTVSGRLELWGRHLRGGYRCLLNVLAHHKARDRTMSVLCQQYLLGAALGNFGTAAELQTLWDAVLNEPLYIEECHCITRPMLESVIAINLLAVSNKRFNPNEVEAVRLQLRRSVPKFEDPLRHHLSYAYYFAIMIHFSRSFSQPVNTEQLAAKAVDHLEWAKQTSGGNCGNILMWLLFKIGPECESNELRTRLLHWCNTHLRTNINTLDTFIKHLQNTWAVSAIPAPETTGFPIEEIKTESYDDT